MWTAPNVSSNTTQERVIQHVNLLINAKILLMLSVILREKAYPMQYFAIQRGKRDIQQWTRKMGGENCHDECGIELIQFQIYF